MDEILKLIRMRELNPSNILYESEDDRHWLRSFIIKSYDASKSPDLYDWPLVLFHEIQTSKDDKFDDVKKLMDRVGGWFYGGLLYSMPEWYEIYRDHLNDILLSR